MPCLDNRKSTGLALIYVAICFDENLLLPAVVLLRSIEEHANAERPIRVYALVSFDIKKLRGLIPEDSSVLEIVATKADNPFAHLARNDYISQGTYLRFLLPELLPDVGKLVYLDVDMIVHHDLSSLWETEPGNFGIAATSDVALTLGSTRWDHFDLAYDGRPWTFAAYLREVLDLPNESGDDYFNAGLLVIDLDLWRRRDIARRTLAFLAERPKLKFMDQDALNHVMKGRYLRLDTRWNAMANCADAADNRLRTLLSPSGRRWERTRRIWREDPWIIHYAGPHKPWATHRPVAHGDVWWDYAQRSAAWPRLAPLHERYQNICREAQERNRPLLAKLVGRLRRPPAQ